MKRRESGFDFVLKPLAETMSVVVLTVRARARLSRFVFCRCSLVRVQ